MAVKLLYYFVFAFTAVAVFLIVQEPYIIEKKSTNDNIPSVVMSMVKNYDITTSGVTSVISADKVRRYKKHDEFDNVNMFKKTNIGYVESVSANKGTLKNRDLELQSDVRYDRSDGLSLRSEKVNYNMDKKILSSNVDFVLSNNKGVTEGKSFVYEMDDGRIEAKNIKAIIKENK